MKLLDRIHDRVYKKNRNFLGIICGGTGSGKSYSCIKMAECLDPNFNVSQIVFSPEEFMHVINSGVMQKGSVIIFEEAGVGISSKDWFTIQNRLMAFVIQTFRHRNFIVFFNVPNMSFIDFSIRALFHMKFETKRIDMKKKQVILKPFEIEYNDRFRKTLYKYPRKRGPGGKIVIVRTMRLGLPEKKLLVAYEKKKDKFTSELNASIERDLRKQNEYDAAKSEPSKKDKIIDLYDKGITSPADISKATGIDCAYVRNIVCNHHKA